MQKEKEFMKMAAWQLKEIAIDHAGRLGKTESVISGDSISNKGYSLRTIRNCKGELDLVLIGQQHNTRRFLRIGKVNYIMSELGVSKEQAIEIYDYVKSIRHGLDPIVLKTILSLKEDLIGQIKWGFFHMENIGNWRKHFAVECPHPIPILIAIFRVLEHMYKKYANHSEHDYDIFFMVHPSYIAAFDQDVTNKNYVHQARYINKRLLSSDITRIDALPNVIRSWGEKYRKPKPTKAKRSGSGYVRNGEATSRAMNELRNMMKEANGDK